MIRIRKSDNVPESLRKENPTSYNDDDVVSQIYKDQDDKCYLCEMRLVTLGQVEHFKPHTIYPTLKYEWTNLLLACGYCNLRKSSGYLNILNPLENNIEEIIKHKIDYLENKINLVSENTREDVMATISFIERLFNGKNGIRDFKAQKLFSNLQEHMDSFIKALLRYKDNMSDENKNIVIDYLKIDKEYLAFKYVIIVDNPFFKDIFGEYVVWNKV